MKDKKPIPEKKKTEEQKIKTRQRRLVVIALLILAIFALLLWLVISFIGSLGEDKSETKAKKYDASTIENYIRENWNEFDFVSFDADSAALVIKSAADYTYEKAEKYGAAVFDEAYFNDYVNYVQQVAIGISVDCDIDGCTVRLDQYSTDGQVIYSVDSNGQITTCWEADKSE